MVVKYKAINLPFRHPFTISKGTKTSQPSLLVELEHFGLKGYGEAPAITYYQVTVENMIEDLLRKKKAIEQFAFTTPERFWHYLHHLIPGNPFLVAALDMAGWDLYGKLMKKPVYQILKGDISRNPLTDYTIGIDSVERMVEKMKEKPWPIYKIKLGTSEDVRILTELRKHTDAVFRIDANAAWSLDEALEKIEHFRHLGVEFIEQPLAKDDWEGMAQLYPQSSLPLIADESCVFEADIDRCVDHFHGINIKLTKCSGMTPAIRMIAKARKAGLKVMVGSMNESSVGTAAIAQLLPFLDYVDMDGPLLLAEDVALGVGFDFGKIRYTGSSGLGVSLTSF